MHSILRSASLLSIVLLFSACVASKDRTTDATDLRDPWALAAEPSDPILAAGKHVFVSCASCHLADAGGRSDGTIPRLAGQHATILERWLRGLRDGSIDLPVMTPFARALTDTEIRQVSAYLSSLPRPQRVGHSAGREDERGVELYRERCLACHGAKAVGEPVLNAPRLCGQHESYLLRRLNEMAGLDPNQPGHLLFVDPVMKVLAAALTSEDRLMVSKHLARLECD